MICPFCGEGELEEKLDHHEYIYKGVAYNPPLHYSVCNVCESETATEEQVVKNKQAIGKIKSIT